MVWPARFAYSKAVVFIRVDVKVSGYCTSHGDSQRVLVKLRSPCVPVLRKIMRKAHRPAPRLAAGIPL